MGKLIGYEGEFAILSSTPTATNQNAWVDFMKAKLASEPKFAKMKLVQVAYGEESEQVNQQQALALAQAFPDLKGIIVPAGIGLPAAARALEQAKLIDKIKLTGLAPATFMTKYIKAGQAEDIWWNVQDLGYLTYYAAQAYAQCKITGKEGETFEAGRLGKYTVGADGEVVLGPAVIVTPAERRHLQVLTFHSPGSAAHLLTGQLPPPGERAAAVEGLLRTQGFDRHVDAAPAGQLHDRVDRIDRQIVDHVIGTEPARHRQPRRQPCRRR